MAIAKNDIQKRVPLWHPTLPFVVLWSEKANCTAVAKWFFSQVGLLDAALRYSPWIHDYEIQVFKQGDYIERCLDAINSGARVIKFVREPYARAFSGYLELCRPHFDEPDEHWSVPIRRKVIADIGSGLDSLEYAFSFHQYLRWLASQDHERLNLHLAKQYRSYERNLQVEVLHIERGKQNFVELEHRFSLKPSSDESSIFESSHHHTKSRVDPKSSVAACYLGIPLRRGRDFQIAEPRIGAVAQDPVGAIVREVFGEDFRAYGYPEYPDVTP